MARARAPVAVLAAAAVAACSHPQHATDRPSGEETQPQREKAVKAAPGRPPVPSSPQGLFAPSAIAQLQDALAARGLLHGDQRNGELDDATSRAVRQFQRSQNLAETGFPDRETLEKLGLDPTQEYGREKAAK